MLKSLTVPGSRLLRLTSFGNWRRGKNSSRFRADQSSNLSSIRGGTRPSFVGSFVEPKLTHGCIGVAQKIRGYGCTGAPKILQGELGIDSRERSGSTITVAGGWSVKKIRLTARVMANRIWQHILVQVS